LTFLSKCSGNFHDQHVVVRDPAGNIRRTFVPSVFQNYDASVWMAYASRWNTQTLGNWGHGMIGSVPYIHIQSWASALTGFDTAMEQFRDSPGVVIDVRMNGGGNSLYASVVIARFADQTRIGGYVRYRNGPNHNDFTAPSAFEFSPGGSWQFTKPVLLLTGARCLSSNEDFISAMRQLPHVTLAGDTTGGATANPTLRSLAAGWSYMISQWFFTTPDGIVVEGHGIPPHVPVPATDADFAAGRDPVLEYAATWAANPTVHRTL